MGAIRDVQMNLLLAQIESARVLGHDINQPFAQVKVSGSKLGIAAVCSCGWISTPSTKRIGAIVKGMAHVGTVIGENDPHPVVDQVPEQLETSAG